jgi:hypothetical protein
MKVFMDSLNETEVKEAFGFGKDEEEEESEEPKTQEFTVVMQEGDKLELTDITEEEEQQPADDEPKEEDSPEESENEEKEAESNVRVFVVSSVDYETDGQEDLDLRQDFTFALDKDDIGDTTDMQEIADEIVDDISDETGFLVSGFYFQEKMPDGTLVDLDAESYEAESNQDIKWGDVKEMDNSKCPFCFRSAFRLIDEEGEEFSVYEEDIAGDNWLLECSRCKAEWNQDGENTLDGGYTGNAEVNENFSAEMEEWNYVQFEETPQGLIISLNRDLTSQSFDGDAADLLEDVRANSNWEWLTADQLGALSEADVLAQGSYSDDGEFEPAENVVYAYTDYQISDWFNKLKDNGVVVFKSFPVEKGAFYQDAEYEAVSAKVTRPVKEEEDEESEDGEGMSTLMKVGLGVGALAVGAAILGAEGEYRCPHCSNELHRLHITEKYTCPNCEGLIYEDFRDGYSDPADFMAEDEGESDYWAGENADWRAEATGSEPSNEHFSAESKLHPGLYRYKGKIGMRKGWTECQECDDIVKQKDVNWYYIKGYGQATICDSCVGKYNYKKDRLSKGGRHGELAILQFMEQDRKDADTVGNPSPSGPSSIPEPAEATGSEPSNENMVKAADTKLAVGLTVAGIGLAVLLGKDRLVKWMDRFNL